MHHLAVIGNPIAHSLSPVIFDIFAKKCKVTLNYTRILAEDENHFSQIVHDFFSQGGLALNVTSPFKHAAYNVAKMHTSRAAFCQTSNFLTLDEDKEIIANTTDGIGLIRDLQITNKLVLENKRTLIIGSGFVLDSILLDLISCNPISIDVLARNKERFRLLQNKFAVGEFKSSIHYDLILNTIPSGKRNQIFSQINKINDNTFCYDLNYTTDRNTFLTAMRKINQNIMGCNGLGMLVEQAKVAFIQLFGSIPDTNTVLVELAQSGYHV